MAEHSQSDILCCYFCLYIHKLTKKDTIYITMITWFSGFYSLHGHCALGRWLFRNSSGFNASADFKINCVKRCISKRMILKLVDNCRIHVKGNGQTPAAIAKGG